MRALRATRIAVVHDKLGTKKMWKMQISIFQFIYLQNI